MYVCCAVSTKQTIALCEQNINVLMLNLLVYKVIIMPEKVKHKCSRSLKYPISEAAGFGEMV